ncbi:F-box protein At5g39450 isoform X2 [Panicum hallii]|uniref:F-box protein At5g39450 isoform X2 n=1 Tax=Panicum hallii TaxID=206008 RepID=UPI000DF4E7A3|nr:F-box protein At5g39450 isoform X2 [Panicum hallii]
MDHTTPHEISGRRDETTTRNQPTMSSGDLHLDGAALILSLPEDVLALISAHLRPRDLLALSATSRRLRDALYGGGADKAWLAQCRRLLPSPPHLLAWRAAAGGSSLAVCRFLHSAAPLLGALWAHQNPELGNLVAAVPGFLSVVAARAIPQELSPRLRWAPVFELLADAHGRPAILFLHGHQPADLFPARLSSLQPHANVLFLEAQTDQDPIASSSHQFPRLAFGDRRRLLDSLVAACRVTLPPDLVAAPLFARSEDDLPVLAARREAMLRLHREAGGGMVCTTEVEGLLEAKKKGEPTPLPSNGGERIRLRRSLSAVAGYVRNSLRQMVTRSVSANSRAEYVDTKHLPLADFLHNGESVGLSLRGARVRLSTYRAWPSMHDNRFALYKLTLQAPMPGREYAGLWGGTFGWPPGRPEDECKPRKALFFLLLSYEVDSEGKLLLIATKVLEGTHYVVHPNGSSMFIARMCEPSTEAFPWQTDGESRNVDVERGFAGEGIANGYGFRYPGSKPGSLFVLQDGQLAFVWRETGAVLTLQRLNLEELMKKGERVPALQPVPNFAYLTKSYSNVFTGFPGSSASPRWTSFVQVKSMNGGCKK